ncbi:hypothetical protein HYQ45_010410 [Verticillium longisporum]|uniref:DNase1 protein n=1 Tax=Verticillium longisporum TaxID=100787 RepID=A0A8I2ZIY0_VERLO|nr:hypothetical protein HYQ45_010410 [Verticillium longisporum]
MQFSQLMSLFGAAALVAATNTVTFVSTDQTDRTIYFTPNAGYPEVAPVEVPAGQSIKSEVPQSWIGNWYSVSVGADNIPGMLGEVAFQGWNDLTYFDVSAIVTPGDHDGVHEMWPAQGHTPTSGCAEFPCNNAYYLWDDVQTKTTPETDLICTLGTGASPLNAGEEVPAVKRDFMKANSRHQSDKLRYPPFFSWDSFRLSPPPKGAKRNSGWVGFFHLEDMKD